MDELRKKFQSTDGRMTLMMLMVEEIRLAKMKKLNKIVSYTDAVSELKNEFNDMYETILNREKNIAIQTVMKDFGFNI